MTGVLSRLLRFGAVGVANTAVYYVAYRILLVAIPYLLAHVSAWLCSVIFSFVMNCWFTFKVRPTLRRFAAFPASSLANLVLTTFGSIVLVSHFHVDERYATLIMGILAIPATFVLTAFILRPSAEDAVAGERLDRV